MKAVNVNLTKGLYWLRKNLFPTPLNCLITIFLAIILGTALSYILDWAVFNSTWNSTAIECRQRQGACWSFIQEKARYIFFGHYPEDQQWRSMLFVLTFFILFLLGQFRRFWSKSLLLAWIVLPLLMALILRGGGPGLPAVEMEEWGGLPLTLSLALFGIAASYPLGIILALARRSSMRILQILSVCYIELIRGIPLISILFMSSVMFPLFIPEGITVSKVLRAQVAIIIFSSAYMAEVVRGGLQAIPKGQYEAAQAIGLNYAQTMGLVILPQALKIVIPPTVNTFIGLFKDTSLVFIIALSDLMFTTKSSLKDSEWLGFTVEGYLFMALIYFIFCYFISRASLHLEKELAR